MCLKKDSAFMQSPVKMLSFISHAERGNNARTGMASDDSSDHIDQNVIDSVFFPDQTGDILGIFLAIPMCDHDNFIVPALHLLLHDIDDLVQGALASPFFSDDTEFSIIGLIFTMVPRTAVALETRPPRCRWFRSSTVTLWQT